MKTSDKVYFLSLATVCSAIAYWMLRDIWRQPDYTVTRAMIERAEMEAIFGDGYVWDDEMDDEEEV